MGAGVTSGGCCNCGTVIPMAHCAPCNIPETTLTLSWYYWKVSYGGPYGTTYTPAGPITTTLNFISGYPSLPTSTWSSGWILGPSDSSTCNTPPVGAANDCCYLLFTLTCNLAQGTNLSIALSSESDGGHIVGGHLTGKSYCHDGTESAQVGAATFTCSPFSVIYGNTGYVGNLFQGGILTA